MREREMQKGGFEEREDAYVEAQLLLLSETVHPVPQKESESERFRAVGIASMAMRGSSIHDLVVHGRANVALGAQVPVDKKTQG